MDRDKVALDNWLTREPPFIDSKAWLRANGYSDVDEWAKEGGYHFEPQSEQWYHHRDAGQYGAEPVDIEDELDAMIASLDLRP